MISTAISPAAVRAGSARAAAAAAVTTGLLDAALAVTQLLAPAQPASGRHFTRGSDYLIESLFAAALLLTTGAVILLARYHREQGRRGRFLTIAATAYAAGTGLTGISSVLTAIRGVETLDVIQFPAIVIWLAGGLLLAIAVVRARVLPVAAGLGFAAALPAAMALGNSGPFALAVLWLAVAAALVTRPPVTGEPAS